MVNHIELVEEKFQQYLPYIKEIYPKERNNKIALKKLADIYQDIVFQNNVFVGLYDDVNAKLFFLSNNFQELTGYKPTTVFNWGSLLAFKAIHYSHYSFPFKVYKINKRFHQGFDKNQLKKIQLNSAGLKLIHGNGSVRRTFLKMKTLVWNEDNYPDISILFGEDVTHLMKGDNYWFRTTSDHQQIAYVHQKGKKEFNDLISDRELKILHLLAKKKSTTEIADELFISRLTVETHRKNMLKKIGAVNSTALVHLCKMAV